MVLGEGKTSDWCNKKTARNQLYFDLIIINGIEDSIQYGVRVWKKSIGFAHFRICKRKEKSF